MWCSPERHGTISGVFKSQIDWIPLEVGGIRPTQGRTLAVMQVSGGSSILQCRERSARPRALDAHGDHPEPIIRRQGAFLEEFDEAGRMLPSLLYYDRVVDVMEELVKFTLLTRDHDGIFYQPLQRAARRQRRRAVTEASKLAEAAMCSRPSCC